MALMSCDVRHRKAVIPQKQARIEPLVNRRECVAKLLPRGDVGVRKGGTFSKEIHVMLEKRVGARSSRKKDLVKQ